ncbi:MAG: hypothetical protein IJ762_00315 [Bacteroidaceae bacterium]|nr:hypothetical protein [Bacteroidaceae bacterium]
MTYNKKSAWLFALLWILMLLLALVLESCRTERIVTVPEYHEHIVHQHDTLIQRDTVQHERNTIVREVDSTAMAAYGIRLDKAERAWLIQTEALRREVSQLRQHQTDTVILHDSIPVPYPVEKPLTWWQSTSIKWFKWLLLLLVAIMGWALRTPIRKLLKILLSA